MPMDAVVLVGGEGTRLRAAVPDVPKPLAPVGGRPFLEILLDWLDRSGAAERVVLTSGYRGGQIDAFARERSNRWRFQISCTREETLLGTGGGLRLAMQGVQGRPVLVLNGDSFLACDVAALSGALESTGARAVLAAARVSDVTRFGALDLGAPGPDGSRPVRRFLEKGGSGVGLINGGVYCLDREAFLSDTPERERCSLEKDVLARWVARKEGLVAAVEFPEGAFLDIGEPDSYKQAEPFFRRLGLL